MIGNFRLPISSSSAFTPPVLTPYVRPADWLSLPSVTAGDQKFVGLHAVFNHDSNFCALQCASNYTVDWGDGVTTNHTENTTAYHVYDYNYAGFVGTESALGYRQAIVTITPQATFNLTKVDLNIRHNQSGLGAYENGWLDIRMAGSFMSTFLAGGSNCWSRMLKCHEFVGTSAFTNTTAMFYGCTSLEKVYLFDTSNVTGVAQMFDTCSSLQEVPFFNTGSCSNMQAFFKNCHRLQSIPLFNIGSVTYAVEMLMNCYSLAEVPLLNFQNMNNCHTFFSGCYSLKSMPLLNMVNVQYAYNMFQNCTGITEFPLFNLTNLLNANNMFQNCYSITSFPLFNLSLCQTMSLTFSGCIGVKEFPLFNTSNVTNMSSCFSNCTSIRTIPLFDTTKVTTFNTCFGSCINLETVPLLNTQNATDMIQMFISCYKLIKLPTFNITKNCQINHSTYGCSSLQELPAWNGNFLTTLNAMNVGSVSISSVKIAPIKVSIEINGMRLSKIALLEVFNNLVTAVGKTITITGNWGADTAVSKTSCGTTAGSAVVTQSNTASLAVGMLVLGTGISTAIAVSFQDSGDTVTLNAHGLINGSIVSFPSITTTTGIAINTPYFVVNATTNTFQVSLTLGGSAIALTTDGTGTVAYGSYIQSIITNTSFTLDKPASATGTVTLTSRILDTSIATLKGWTVTG